MPILIQANQLPILSATSIYEISALIFCPILPYPPHIASGKVWRALAAPVASCGLLQPPSPLQTSPMSLRSHRHHEVRRDAYLWLYG